MRTHERDAGFSPSAFLLRKTPLRYDTKATRRPETLATMELTKFESQITAEIKAAAPEVRIAAE